MRRSIRIFAAALLLAGLIGCGQGVPASPGSSSGTVSEQPSAAKLHTALCRIVDGAEDGQLLLASLDEDGGIYRLTVENTPVTVDGAAAKSGDLSDGMEVTVTYTGGIQESYPAVFAGVTGLAAQSPIGGSCFDLCGFYLSVLEDLWDTDPGLNADIRYVGVDLSRAPGDLTEAEKTAVAWRFGELHGCTPLTGTFDELADQGYIDKNRLYWKDGVLFSISAAGTDDEKYSLPTLRFDAQKWRSGDGADFFNDCTAVWPEFGTWTGYAVGSRAIS